MKTRSAAFWVFLIIVFVIFGCDNPTGADPTTANGFFVTYSANNAEFGTPPIDDTAYSVDQDVAVERNYGGLERDGFGFSGWNTHADGSGEHVLIGEVFAMPAHDVTLYAMWGNPEPCYLVNAAIGAIVSYVSSGEGCSETDIQIPPVVHGVLIRVIAGGAFIHRGLTSVDIPDTIVEIHDWAFNNNELSHVTLPRDLVSIGDYAFARNNIESITFGAAVKHIGAYSFFMNELDNLVVPHGVETIARGAFSDSGMNTLTAVEVPGSIAAVSTGAFSGNKIHTLILHEGIETLVLGAFGNNELTSITIPNSVTKVGHGVFGNNDLTTVTIGASVEIANDHSLGTHGDSFRAYYIENELQAGIYSFDGVAWSRDAGS